MNTDFSKGFTPEFQVFTSYFNCAARLLESVITLQIASVVHGCIDNGLSSCHPGSEVGRRVRWSQGRPRAQAK